MMPDKRPAQAVASSGVRRRAERARRHRVQGPRQARHRRHLSRITPAAYAAWKAKAQQTVDNAHMRYFIVHLHRLLDPEATAARSSALSRGALRCCWRSGLRSSPWVQRAIGVAAARIPSPGLERPPVHDRAAGCLSSGSRRILPVIVAMWHGQHFLMPFVKTRRAARQGADLAPPRRRDQRHRRRAARHRDHPRLGHRTAADFFQQGRRRRLSGDAGCARAGLQHRR